jgi:hypothetical protein
MGYVNLLIFVTFHDSTPDLRTFHCNSEIWLRNLYNINEKCCDGVTLSWFALIPYFTVVCLYRDLEWVDAWYSIQGINVSTG